MSRDAMIREFQFPYYSAFTKPKRGLYAPMGVRRCRCHDEACDEWVADPHSGRSCQWVSSVDARCRPQMVQAIGLRGWGADGLIAPSVTGLCGVGEAGGPAGVCRSRREGDRALVASDDRGVRHRDGDAVSAREWPTPRRRDRDTT